MNPQGINESYDVISTLCESAASAVCLVRHKQMGDIRVLKAVQKSQPDAKNILSEANLLSGIKSSQIPTIYDVGETTEYFYLVEEYIKGQSLLEYLLDNEEISYEEMLKIAVEICEIVEKLHDDGSDPLLYRDMKPEHVILTDEGVKLIDFGISIRQSTSASVKPMGTPNWSAPEQLSGIELDVRADVYSIGKVIELMMEYEPTKKAYRLKSIVENATKTNLSERTSSVKILKEELESLQDKRVYEKFEKKHLNFKIAVVGAAHSVGATSISIKFCSYLNKMKHDACYKGPEHENVVNTISKNIQAAKIKKGVLYHKSFKGLMEYGPAIKQYRPSFDIMVEDLGIAKNEIPNGDIIFFIASGRPWQRTIEYPNWISEENVYVIDNFSNRVLAGSLATQIKKKVFIYPQFKNLALNKNEELFFKKILKKEMDKNAI